jgi:hypothetical protein
MTVTWASPVRVWARSGATDVAGLRPGRDLLVHARRDEAPRLAQGVLLDDLLEHGERLRLDERADAELRAWRARRDEQLTVDGVCLPHVHEIELRADVMLPELRLAEGLLAAFERNPPAAVRLEGFDGPSSACLAQLLRDRDIDCELGAPGPPPSYPVTFPRPAPRGIRSAAARARRALGTPGRVRGDVLVIPHWHLLPLWSRLAADGLQPVLDPANLPAIGRGGLVSAARSGGWIGHPGARARARSRGALEAIAGAADGPDPLARLLDRRALDLLAAVAAEDLATAAVFRRAFGSGLRVAVTLSDAAPVSRLLGLAAREHGRQLVHVQHGFLSLIPGGFGSPPTWSDGMAADRVAVWSRRDLEHLTANAPGEVVHTGNPAAAAMVPAGGAGGRGTILVLAQPIGILSCAVDARAMARHLDTALAAIAKLAAGLPVRYRPHPYDRPVAGAVLAAAQRHGLDVTVDAERPIDAALADAHLCVGSTSTATLQAVAAGVPTAFLRTAGVDAQPPLDGRGLLPAAGSADELADRLSELSARGEPLGRDEALVALGVEPDALERVAAVVEAAC